MEVCDGLVLFSAKLLQIRLYTSYLTTKNFDYPGNRTIVNLKIVSTIVFFITSYLKYITLKFINPFLSI